MQPGTKKYNQRIYTLPDTGSTAAF